MANQPGQPQPIPPPNPPPVPCDEPVKPVEPEK